MIANLPLYKPTVISTDPPKPALLRLGHEEVWKYKNPPKDEWRAEISLDVLKESIVLKAGSKHDVHLLLKQLRDEVTAAVAYMEGNDA